MATFSEITVEEAPGGEDRIFVKTKLLENGKEIVSTYIWIGEVYEALKKYEEWRTAQEFKAWEASKSPAEEN